MRARRGLLLLEVVVGLALLALLGVALVQLQVRATRQYRSAQESTAVARQAEALLLEWRLGRVAVTLPASGAFDDQLRWRRDVRPVRIGPGALADQISLVVTRAAPHQTEQEVYRADWYIPRPERRR